MNTKFWILALSVALAACSHAKKEITELDEANPKAKDCASTKEYVTSIEFFRSHPELTLPESEMRRLSFEISKGCTGSAERFIRISNVLMKSGITANNALESATKFIGKGDREVGAFVEAYKTAFLAEYLDLDIKDSLAIAHRLTDEFNGDSATAVSDFRRIAQYCTSSQGMELDRPECTKLAARVAKSGENSKESVGPAFIRAYEHFKKKTGLQMSVQDSIKNAETIVGYSPMAVDNFLEAHSYALSEKGLKMSGTDAFEFAMNMAKHTDFAAAQSGLKKEAPEAPAKKSKK